MKKKMRKPTNKALKRAAGEARQRVSNYSPAKRAALLKKARSTVASGGSLKRGVPHD